MANPRNQSLMEVCTMDQYSSFIGLGLLAIAQLASNLRSLKVSLSRVDRLPLVLQMTLALDSEAERRQPAGTESDHDADCDRQLRCLWCRSAVADCGCGHVEQSLMIHRGK